jgi:ubiquinone/menaquinone biosynthesis C-methylase UbiE
MDEIDLVAVYAAGDEDGRLLSVRNRVEWERTCELLHRWLPDAPGRLLDVGGASGRYASWLEGLGYEVQVLDPVPGHVERARSRGLKALVGDARQLPFRDCTFDAVLLMGPLYHLPSASDRALALRETVRVCTSSGVVVAAAMSRWAKPAAIAARGQLSDTDVQRHLVQVLIHGHDTEGDAFDRISYNHDPDQLRAEFKAADLTEVQVVGIEGPLGAFAREDPELHEIAIHTARMAETLAPHLSIHILAFGRTG